MRFRGMALLMVIVSLAVISAVVTDLLIDQTSSYQVALRQRDALKAEALAQSGLNLGQLFLVIQSEIQVYFTQFASLGVTLPKPVVWEMLPIDSNLFSGLISGDLPTTFGIDVSEAVKKRKEEEKAKNEKILQEKEAKTRGTDGIFIAPEGGFGAFEGTFGLKVTDEESKISLRKWPEGQPAEKFRTKKLLAALMLPSKYNYLFKKIGRLELLANIFDYIDADQIRIDPNAIGEAWGIAFGGSEQDLYLTDKGVQPKNAYFDSLGELNLVHGFTDRHMQAFGEAMTIYGDGSKINILSAKEPVIGALVRYCAQNEQDPLFGSRSWTDGVVKKWFDYKSAGQGPVSPEGFIKFLTGTGLSVNKKDCQDALGVESKYFTLKSEATVGSVTRSMSLVVRVDKSGLQRFYFRGQ